MDRYLIEKCLVEHCSATLASMKSANLFNMTFADDTDVEDQIEFWNQCMKEKGIRQVENIVFQRKSGQIGTGRTRRLEADIAEKGVGEHEKNHGPQGGGKEEKQP